MWKSIAVNLIASLYFVCFQNDNDSFSIILVAGILNLLYQCTGTGTFLIWEWNYMVINELVCTVVITDINKMQERHIFTYMLLKVGYLS